MNRKERIQELQRKNRISHICKRWNENGIKITIGDFLDVDKTEDIQKRIKDMMQKMDDGKKSETYPLDRCEVISIYKDKIRNNIIDECNYVYFLQDSYSDGCIVLGGNIIKENMEFIICESGYFNNVCRIYCCSMDVSSGVCLWRGEYDHSLYVW